MAELGLFKWGWPVESIYRWRQHSWYLSNIVDDEMFVFFLNKWEISLIKVKNTMYSGWRVPDLKEELKRRGASLRGRKSDLIERLEYYDLNSNFGYLDVDINQEDTMVLPDLASYRDINSSTPLPAVTNLHIRQYLCFDQKKIGKAKDLYEARYLTLARAATVNDFTYVKGFCKKTMKPMQYEVDIKFHKNGHPEESHCECPAGSGTEAKCKHVTVLLLGIQHMVSEKIMLLHQVSTQILQSFHVPKKLYTASPIVAQKLPKKKAHKILRPYPVQNLDKENYNNKIRNLVSNFPDSTMPLKQLYEPANPYALLNDHSYTSFNPEMEMLEKLKLHNISQNEITQIQELTKSQKKCSMWHIERKYRLTASKFHTICNLKDTSKRSFSRQLLNQKEFSARATTHGILNEPIAIEQYCSLYDLNVQGCRLFISMERPYLAATPDGLLGDETVIEVKCPYSSRAHLISTATVPYLQYENGNLTLKKTCPYYYQIQGQLYCTNRKYCNLIIYTYKDMQIIFISRDEHFIKVMMDKLDHFYNNYFKPEILKQCLYYEYDLIKNKTT